MAPYLKQKWKSGQMKKSGEFILSHSISRVDGDPVVKTF
jgi:hypothetical protein